MIALMALDERAFFTEKPETRPAKHACPRCRRTNDYSVRWVRRARKDRLPSGADESDRAKFAKLRDHLLRLDDELTCKSCGKRFEIPSLQSLLFLENLEGLPKDDDDEEPTLDNAGDAGEPQSRSGPGGGGVRPGAVRQVPDEDAPPAAQRPASPDGDAAGATSRANLPARFTRKSTGWRG